MVMDMKTKSSGLPRFYPVGKAMEIFILVIMLVISMLPVFVNAADAPIPKQIMEKIKAKAATDFPDDISTQKKVIKTQTAAYNHVKNYNNKKVPVVVLNTIKGNTAKYYPFDYSAQLFFINQQVNSYLKLGIISERLFPPKIVECENLKWRLTLAGKPAIYRGTVEPGTVDVIYVEVRSGRGLIGQNYGFPNPGGAWEVMVWGDYNIRKKHKEKFYCEKY
jgi:hypothetical protein